MSWNLRRRALGTSCLAVATLVASCASESGAQSTGVDDSTASAPLEPAVAYRRVFVPANRASEWPIAGNRYLPVEREEFERLVQQAEDRKQLSDAGAAQFMAAQYSAQLTADGVLKGTARLDVRLADDSPCVASLDPWNAIITESRWEFDPEEPATLGLWTGADGRRPRYGVLAPRSGRLRLEWQTPVAPWTDDSWEYVLQFPSALTQRLELDLPAGCVPEISSGLLVEQAESSTGAGRRWIFQLAGALEHRLHVKRPASAASARKRSAPLLAMTEAYHVAPHGVDYDVELRLLGRAEPLTELRIASPAGLRIASVTVNRQPAAWRYDEDDASTLLVTLPATDGATTVQIVGAAAAVFDAPWTLPGIVPAGVFWTEGTSTLWIDPKLEVRSIAPRECSLLNVVGIGGNAGEVYRVQAWSKEATVELVVGDRRGRLESRSGAVVEFAEREIVARWSAVVWAAHGRMFDVAAPLGPDWAVESVEASPADGLVEWHVEEGPSRRLRLQLRRSPAELQPLTINLVARKPRRGWSRTQTAGDLDLLALPGRSAERWLTVKDLRGNAVIPDAKLADAVVPFESLLPSQRNLLPDAAGGVTFDLRRADRSGTVTLLSTTARYGGEGRMEVCAVGGGFEHRAQLQCRPTTGAVGELRVFSARPLPPNVRWEVDGDATRVAVEAVSAPTSDQDVPARWTEYRLRLAQPRSVPFEIRAAWRGVGEAEATVNALTLPDAEGWQAWALLRGSPRQFAVDARDAAPTPAAPMTQDDVRLQIPLLGSFRLGDDPNALPAASPALVAAAATVGDAVDVVAWHCDATTRQFADGRQTHRIVYQLDSRQPTDLELKAPDEASFVSLVAGDRSVSSASLKDSESVKFHLPGDVAPQTLIVEMASKGRPLEDHRTIKPLLPRASFRVIRGKWTLEWPAGYRMRESESDSSHGWLHRLVGPFARADGRQWYDGMLLARVDAADRNADSLGRRPGASAGWSSTSQSFVDAPLAIELVRASSAQARSHVAWLVAAVLAAWLWLRRAKAILFAAAAAAIVSLVAPEGRFQMPQAIFLGIAAGVAMREAFRRFGKETDKLPTNAPATILLALAVAMPGAASTTAQEPSASSPPQVLFPVDDQGNPVGTDVYVPAPMAADLLPASAQRSDDDVAFVDARYQLELAPDSASGEIVCRQVAWQLRWESYRPNVRVDFPLGRDDGQWDAASFSLNGQPIVPSRNENGTSAFVMLDRPGKHELSATLVPPTEADGQRGRVRMAIPKASGATVEISHPAGLEGVRPIGASLPATSLNATRTTFQLGAVDVLDVSWPARARVESSGASVEQLSVLELDPAVARLDVRLRFSGTGMLDVIRLSTSPQLKLTPLPEGSPLELLPSDPRRPNIVELRFSSPPPLPVAASLQFQLQRTLSVGRIDYPNVDVLGMTVRRRHFVVNADRRLRIREEAATGLTPINAAELEQAWGTSFGTPALQYAVAAEQPTWVVEVAPLAPRFASRESLTIRCDEKAARFVYEAAITDVDGEMLTYRLAMPANLSIDDVTAEVDGPDRNVPVRWARVASRGVPAPGADQAELFLDRPLGEPHRLRIEGRMSYAATRAPTGAGTAAAQRRLQMPLIGLESALGSPINVTLYRTNDVLVDWPGEPALSSESAPRPEAGRGRRLGEVSLSRTAAMPELVVRPNDVEFAVDSLLTLELDSAEPVAECRLQGSATRGILDSIRLVVGKNWQGPFVCEPAGRIVRRDIPGDAVHQLLEVQLARPVPAGEEFSLSVRGPISLEADQRIRFPSLRIVGAKRQRGYLTLPPASGNETAEWTLRGLEPEALPPKLAAAAAMPSASQTLRIGVSRFVAEQRVFPDAMRDAACRLIENRVAVDAEGRVVAVSEIVVQAGGRSDCQVQLPLGSQLLFAAVDGTPLFQAKAAGGIWHAPTGPRYLPRVFLLAYRLPQFKETSPRRLSPPQVSVDGKLLAPRKVLWQVADAKDGFDAADESNALTQSQFAVAARQSRIAAVVDSNSLASQLHEWEAAQWRQPWLDRLAAGDATLAEQDPPTWTRLRERLTTDPQVADAGVSVNLSTCWDDAADSRASYFQGDADGGLTLVRNAPPWEAARWFAAVALAGVVGTAWRYPSALRPLATSLRRWPHAWAIMAGSLWWLFLTPSLLGAAIVAVATAAHFKSRARPLSASGKN